MLNYKLEEAISQNLIGSLTLSPYILNSNTMRITSNVRNRERYMEIMFTRRQLKFQHKLNASLRLMLALAQMACGALSFTMTIRMNQLNLRL